MHWHIADRILNHEQGVIRGVAAIYNRHAYLDERRAAHPSPMMRAEIARLGRGNALISRTAASPSTFIAAWYAGLSCAAIAAATLSNSITTVR